MRRGVERWVLLLLVRGFEEEEFEVGWDSEDDSIMGWNR